LETEKLLTKSKPEYFPKILGAEKPIKKTQVSRRKEEARRKEKARRKEIAS